MPHWAIRQVFQKNGNEDQFALGLSINLAELLMGFMKELIRQSGSNLKTGTKYSNRFKFREYNLVWDFL
jgi:hypothetical protein